MGKTIFREDWSI